MVMYGSSDSKPDGPRPPIIIRRVAVRYTEIYHAVVGHIEREGPVGLPMGLIQRVGARSTGYNNSQRFWCDAFTNQFEVAAHGGLLGDVEEEAFLAPASSRMTRAFVEASKRSSVVRRRGRGMARRLASGAARRLAPDAARLRRARRLARVGFGGQERRGDVYAAACAVQRILMTNSTAEAQRGASKPSKQQKVDKSRSC